MPHHRRKALGDYVWVLDGKTEYHARIVESGELQPRETDGKVEVHWTHNGVYSWVEPKHIRRENDASEGDAPGHRRRRTKKRRVEEETNVKTKDKVSDSRGNQGNKTKGGPTSTKPKVIKKQTPQKGFQPIPRKHILEAAVKEVTKAAASEPKRRTKKSDALASMKLARRRIAKKLLVKKDVQTQKEIKGIHDTTPGDSHAPNETANVQGDKSKGDDPSAIESGSWKVTKGTVEQKWKTVEPVTSAVLSTAKGPADGRMGLVEEKVNEPPAKKQKNSASESTPNPAPWVDDPGEARGGLFAALSQAKDAIITGFLGFFGGSDGTQ